MTSDDSVVGLCVVHILIAPYKNVTLTRDNVNYEHISVTFMFLNYL